MAGRERRDADDMDALGRRQRRDFLRRREQRTNLDLEAKVGEGRGDDLLPAVVAVLAHLGDENARPAPSLSAKAWVMAMTRRLISVSAPDSAR